MNRAERPDPVARRTFVQDRREAMLELLARLTRAESPSDVPESQAEVRSIIATELEQRGFAVRRVPGRSSGGMLHARPAAAGRPAQLILGHYDTVWPVGTLAERPFTVDGNVIRGPGVFDMKAGLAQIGPVIRMIVQKSTAISVAARDSASAETIWKPSPT